MASIEDEKTAKEVISFLFNEVNDAKGRHGAHAYSLDIIHSIDRDSWSYTFGATVESDPWFRPFFSISKSGVYNYFSIYGKNDAVCDISSCKNKIALEKVLGASAMGLDVLFDFTSSTNGIMFLEAWTSLEEIFVKMDLRKHGELS